MTPMQQNAEGLLGANFYTFRFKVLDIRAPSKSTPSQRTLGACG